MGNLNGKNNGMMNTGLILT